MEDIVSFKDGTSAYVDDNSVVLTSKKKSKTPMYAVICIDLGVTPCTPGSDIHMFSDTDYKCTIGN